MKLPLLPLLLGLIAAVATPALAGGPAATCSVQIARIRPGNGLVYLNLNEVELLSSLSPVTKITPLSTTMSSEWSTEFGLGKCFDGDLATTCATNRSDTKAAMLITFDCGANSLAAVRIYNRPGTCCNKRIDEFALTLTDAVSNTQTTRFASFGSGLGNYTFVTLTACPDPCLSMNCPSPGECEASVSCSAGACVTVDKPDNTSCNGVPNGVCRAGVCTDRCAGVTCACPGECVASNTCSSVSGACVAVHKADNTTCSSISGGVCRSGVCTDSCTGVTCSSPGECQASVSCSAGACVAVNKPDNTSCSGVANGVCRAGVCKSGCTGVTCACPGECQASNTCSSASGACVAVNKAENTTCSGVSNGVCRSGVCRDACQGVTCDPVQCATSTCVAGGCQTTPLAEGASCSWTGVPVGTCQSSVCTEATCITTTQQTSLPWLPDTCDKAIYLCEGTNYVTNTVGGVTSSSFSHPAYFYFKAPSTGGVTLSMCGSWISGQTDLQMSLFEVQPTGGLCGAYQFDGSDDACDTMPEIQNTVTAGNFYLVSVASSVLSAPEDFAATLTISFSPN